MNPGYAAFQIAKALTASEEHRDPAIRERAKERISKWETVLRSILTGSVEYGSRVPIKGVPAWVTLEVLTGGFATGEMLAGGPLQDHEKKRLAEFPGVPAGDERRALNAYCLTDTGLAELVDRLRTGRYDIAVPEEGALMVVAWLAQRGDSQAARELVAELAPYFSRLRFYPVPRSEPRRFGSRVHVKSVGDTVKGLYAITPNKKVLAQKDAVQVWAPLHDRIVALFLETLEDGWPCRRYPGDWAARASSILGEYERLTSEHPLGGKHARPNGHQRQLRELLRKCANNPKGLSGREVGRIRLILSRYLEKRGTPNSPECAEARRRQAGDVDAPLFHSIARVVVSRLDKHPNDDGLDDVRDVAQDVDEGEATAFGIHQGTRIPPSIRRKVERCLNETVDVLVERGVITSGEVLARVLPQLTSGLRAAGISDPTLRPLYAAVYRAFRRRRSLLLLNLEKQVSIEELPWVAVINRFRSDNLSTRELSKQTLEEIVTLALTSFPHVILPNKLVQELRALTKGADLHIPLVDEVAADIFMGTFSGKFVESAHRAADLLEGTLYPRYYGIDYAEVRRIRPTADAPRRTWFWPRREKSADTFAELCASRAGVSLGTWDPATNGMIIEQQQILTTQNLATLAGALDLTETLRSRLVDMAKQCFVWLCKRHQMKIGDGHARLIMVKNTAYAWRQMMFFLSLASSVQVADFLGWAENHLSVQAEQFRNRFRPAMAGLSLACAGSSIETDSARGSGARRFLGWSKTQHWLLADEQPR